MPEDIYFCKRDNGGYDVFTGSYCRRTRRCLGAVRRIRNIWFFYPQNGKPDNISFIGWSRLDAVADYYAKCPLLANV